MTLIDLELKDPILTGPLMLHPLFVPTAAPDDYLTGVDLEPDVLEVDESYHRARVGSPEEGR
jgi:hypothetical protein